MLGSLAVVEGWLAAVNDSDRFDTLEAALAATGLTVTSEVRARAGSEVVPS